MNFSDYEGIYVIAIPKDGQIQKVTGELIGEARRLASELSSKVSVVLIGTEIADFAPDLISMGADVVYVIESDVFSHYDGAAYQKALGSFFKDKKANIVLFGADPYGRDLAPRLAAELVCGVTADVTELSVDPEEKLVVWSRPAMGGNIMADIISPNYRPQVGTIRQGIFPYPERDKMRRGEIIHVPSAVTEDDLGTVLKAIIPAATDDNPVDEADIIVAGGRGIRSLKDWKQIHELAELLGAAVGCSRPVAETGWESHSHQIGQTGKAVSPKIYFALGISGAMQHVCAVNVDVLVAINKDPKAPIMDIADYAVVADIREFLPIFIEKIKEIKSQK